MTVTPAAVFAALAAAGCGAPSARPAIGNTAPRGELSPRLEDRLPAVPQFDPDSPLLGQQMPTAPATCTSTALRLETDDKNGDGKPEVWRRYQSYPNGKVVLRCKQADVDGDGTVDLVRAFDHDTNEVLELGELDYIGRAGYALVPDPATGAVSIVRDTDGDGRVDSVYD